MFVFMTLIFIFSLVGADIGCTGTSIKSSNNWYCSAVTRMSYQGVGPVGNSAYPLVVHMNGVTGECEKTSQAFSGKLAPLNDDVSHIHNSVSLYTLYMHDWLVVHDDFGSAHTRPALRANLPGHEA